MAFVTLEDLVGTIEIIVFPRQFEKSRASIVEGKKLFITGEANIEENGAGKVIANSIMEFEQMPAELWIAFKDKETYMSEEQELLNLLLQHKGNDKVMVALAKERQRKALPVNYRVDANEAFVEQLKQRYGEDFVKVVV
jgi:DNA polymerase-3 subunit alpha